MRHVRISALSSGVTEARGILHHISSPTIDSGRSYPKQREDAAAHLGRLRAAGWLVSPHCVGRFRPAGTTIHVRDLFYNVPARKKFLRSEQTEIAHIASLATHYSLAHPSKSFSLRHNNTDLLDVSPVATLRERVYQVFGSSVLEDLIDLGERDRDLTLPAEPGEEPGYQGGSRHFRLRAKQVNQSSLHLPVKS